MDIYQRLEALEQACAGSIDLAKQVLTLEAEVDSLLGLHGARTLNWQRLSQMLDFTDATSATPHATKRHVVDARATEILQLAAPPALEMPSILPIENALETEIEQTVHDFDETTMRSVCAARMYLDQLHSAKNSPA